MAELTETRETVRDRYAAAAKAAKAAAESDGGCCGSPTSCGDGGVFGGWSLRGR